MRTCHPAFAAFAVIVTAIAVTAPRAAAAQSSPAPAASTSPVPATSPSPAPASPAPVASGPPATADARLSRARDAFLAWQRGSVDVDQYIPAARAQFTPDAVRNVASTYLKPLGALKTFAFVATAPYQGITVYQYRATGASGAIDELIAWDAAGKIQLIFFRPPQ